MEADVSKFLNDIYKPINLTVLYGARTLYWRREKEAREEVRAWEAGRDGEEIKTKKMENERETEWKCKGNQNIRIRQKSRKI